MSFITCKLGDVCLVRRGTAITQKQAIDGDIPVVAGGLKPTYFHNTANRFNTTITVSGSGANAGYVNLWKQPIFASDCSTLEVNDSKIDILYIYYFLLSKQDYIYKKLKSGAAQPHVYGKDIAEIDVQIPPLQIQEKIVQKLDLIFTEIDKARVAAEANVKNTKALFQSYLAEVFERGGEGWESLTIKDLIKIRSGDFLPAKNMSNEGTIDVYGGNGISGRHNLHNLSGENIIIGRVGAKCGNVRLVNGDVWITDNAFYVSEYKRDVNKEFLSIALAHKDLRKLANQMAQPVISFTTIKDAELKIPASLDKQVEILKIKNFIESQVQIIENSNKKKIDLLNSLKQSILKQAFNVELVKG